MPRIATGLSILMLALLPAEQAFAAGSGRGPGPGSSGAAVHSSPAGGAWRGASLGGHRLSSQRLARPNHQGGRRFWGGSSGFYPFDAGGERTILREVSGGEEERPLDRDSFEHMPVRMGIAASPVGRPVIYRIEGSKARPIVRVLRVGIDDRRAGLRHLATAEGGNAEILTLKPR
ncbi:hypothetical protein DWF00_11115 [Bosea caraganae]|uniref:Uncharacterized protein n=1 Tax=Bosea caraganae TaxID=2763117 RepID=A0A370LC12_9HYPH|nr:hypothetical protein [Bosea caraganae]RDJ27491.1 hypothetical protein DWF00_11115 [Bosea caraganae]RDJ29506.1 hypothetical protein DWE98_02885 [Bosea caraganae]